MIAGEELSSLYTFLKATGEGNLKKMMVDAKFTEAHLRILMKIVRACDEKQFIDHAQKGDFPKVKLQPQEVQMKDKFWGTCFETFKQSGLISGASVAA